MGDDRLGHGASNRSIPGGTSLYAFIARLLLPTAWWGRMKVEGVAEVPESGPVLVVPNHDSQWDPLMVAIALR